MGEAPERDGRETARRMALTGLGLVGVAFVCALILGHRLFKEWRAREAQLVPLRESVARLKEKKSALEEELALLRARAGRSVEISRILDASKALHGEEAARREGYLWREAETGRMMVTLGALQGLRPGRRLAVYEGDRRVGWVEVEKTLDVIAYVEPVGPRKDTDWTAAAYRVVME